MKEKTRIACYPSENAKLLRIVGFVLIGAGALLVILCIPCWAWLAVVGLALIVLGVFLIRL